MFVRINIYSCALLPPLVYVPCQMFNSCCLQSLSSSCTTHKRLLHTHGTLSIWTTIHIVWRRKCLPLLFLSFKIHTFIYVDFSVIICFCCTLGCFPTSFWQFFSAELGERACACVFYKEIICLSSYSNELSLSLCSFYLAEAHIGWWCFQRHRQRPFIRLSYSHPIFT